MHELSVCQALLSEVERVAHEHQATRVTLIRLHIGPLSGVEPQLLEQAFPIAAAGTLAEHAGLRIDCLPVRVRCKQCGATTAVLPNRLVCGQCGDWRTSLVSGDELQLAQVELDRQPADRGSTCQAAATGTEEID